MQTRQDNHLRREVQFPVPLGVYREIAAHLRQVEGVEVELQPQTSQEFDYNRSQIGSMWIQYDRISDSDRKRVEQILAYYRNRYNA